MNSLQVYGAGGGLLCIGPLGDVVWLDNFVPCHEVKKYQIAVLGASEWSTHSACRQGPFFSLPIDNVAVVLPGECGGCGPHRVIHPGGDAL